MPKIVDHETHSQDLARRAAKYFSDHGYAGTSMRKVAADLGLTKSALYHYFPTKEALFLECTKQVMAAFDKSQVDPCATEAENLSNLSDVLRQDFPTEMALIFDYLRGKTQAEIAVDEAMQVAIKAYRKAFVSIVGEERADEVMARVFGILIMEYFSGRLHRAYSG